MKIGYQGIPGSNSWYAANLYITKNRINALLVPLTTSSEVANKLRNRYIDLGICAFHNSTAGKVKETEEALKNLRINIKQEIILPIEHSLFALPDSENITKIASHIQALMQTKEYRLNHYPDAIEIETKDTALAARMLSEGLLDKNTAVICRYEAGELYGLKLIERGIEDKKDNKTLFKVFSL